MQVMSQPKRAASFSIRPISLAPIPALRISASTPTWSAYAHFPPIPGLLIERVDSRDLFELHG
ncbi:hypothetical protein X745_31745 [Mesorhizobium sp. LNJC374B00]|nr:hypothetical protein X745_31745 [Mesorhizobium sp. LNJC374B00]